MERREGGREECFVLPCLQRGGYGKCFASLGPENMEILCNTSFLSGGGICVCFFYDDGPVNGEVRRSDEELNKFQLCLQVEI